jgi:CDGSH-type Zn-finger protein
MNPANLPKVAAARPVALELEAGDYWWCACGLSEEQPMCDGSHKGSGMAPKKFTVAEKQKVWLCQCKHTGDSPFCDGTHNKLPAPAAA